MPDLFRKFVIFHDYGSEGWQPLGSCDSIKDAVRQREADLASGGGTSLIFEFVPTLEAYTRAHIEPDRTPSDRVEEKTNA